MKKIIHVDMDCFYAQVEMRDNPQLKNVPLAVGGAPKTRSVLCTSNYLARKFGVKSAMPTDLAIKKCPGLVVVPPDFKKYQEASEIIQNVFYQYTDLVEPLSLDEAFLDVSHIPNATLLLAEIKKQILKETDLTSSIGLAPNKFLAKIASDWKKPDGQFVIRPNEVMNFVLNLDVRLIPGVGIKSLQVLHALNIKTCKDIQNTPPYVLIEHFGKFGQVLIEYAKGIDNRDVIPHYDRKSLSVENTFLTDYYWSPELEVQFNDVLDELNRRLLNFLESEDAKRVKKIFAKVRFNDFTRTTAEVIISQSETFNLYDYRDLFLDLLKNNLNKKEMPVRLIGLGVRFKKDDEADIELQLPLFNYGTTF